MYRNAKLPADQSMSKCPFRLRPAHIPFAFASSPAVVACLSKPVATSSYTPFHHPHSLSPPLTRLPLACAEFGNRYWLWLRAKRATWTFRLGRVDGSRWKPRKETRSWRVSGKGDGEYPDVSTFEM